ncbi:teichuronopeptide biosynthesis [Salipaludibacillus agaradhaerens]|uniref:Teichuronopeptide biosynthesis n=1 Tax=Salipaludibacillus agaradhaerens TaxID=76935 RepID=A0A9Q4FUK6_SALAG|nr:ATP-grasp fold amidoligase family protein [Salipaludibacillus agaradhaerens]MCR6094935.1 teichuronopeptide biosynthesis [Salipaludibacillus agaradhaerens]MCR6115507.1 teichuronopeptide biosynthesis [Salipaludibacillus agaradhaerens]
MANKEEQLLVKLIKQQSQIRRIEKDYYLTSKALEELKSEYENVPMKSVRKVVNFMFKRPFLNILNLVKKVKKRIVGKKYYKIKEENRQLKTNEGKLEHEVKILNSKCNSLSQELNERHIEISMNKLKTDPSLSSQVLMEQVISSYENGEIIKAIEELVKVKRDKMDLINEALYKSIKLASKEEDTVKYFIYKKILSGLNAEEVPELLLRGMEDKQIASLSELSSFKGLLTMRLRRYQLGEKLPEWQLDDKQKAVNFAKKYGFKVSESLGTYSLNSLPEKKCVAIKPKNGAGSRGVYLVISENKIIDVKRSQQLVNKLELRERMNQDLEMEWVGQDEWIMEPIYFYEKETKEPARDLKFYCFYGKVKLILEVNRYPEVRYCWWTAEGDRISTGKYENQLMDGDGFPLGFIKQVEDLSQRIPAPFCRIDFLKSEGEIIFGEVTPKPGNYDKFNDKIDNYLGESYLEAEGRLMTDLLKGKTFPEFQ